MSQSRLDETFALFQTRLGEAEGLTPTEPFVSDNPAGVNAPLRALTLLVGEQPLALLGLTLPTLAAQSPNFVTYLARRARARHIPYLALGNQREAILLKTPARDDQADEPLRRYPPLRSILPNAAGPLTPPERNDLLALANRLAADLLALRRDGRLDMVLPDPDFFVDRLTRAVDILKPAVKQALQTKLGMDAQFGQALGDWAVLQGIPADLRSPNFAEAVVRQAIYRLLGKIIFYQSLRRAIPRLPEMDLAGLDTGQVLPRLNHCFAEAHKIDYHAVFREDIVDRLPFPAAASAELRDLVDDLNTRDFAHLPQDVVGAVFERLIPPEDRHALGQYFTPEPLVDLITALCVRNPTDHVLDPTCGSGTFLIRAYDRLRARLGVHDHNRLLGQIWGVDVAPFPAELATINLFRQQVGEPGNFPRIINDDFFNVVPGGSYRFPPLKAPPEQTDADHLIDEPIPQFEAIVGNFPYISADRVERSIKGYRAKVTRRLAENWLQAYPDGFTFKAKADQKQFQAARQKGMEVTPFLQKAETTISTYADLYVSLFWHAAAFLKPGGRMGVITSNAWLDVGYGHALQRFLLDHFKLIAILESRCEPWFEQAAVNTVVTILERCESSQERDDHPARFVQIKRPLAELIPHDMRLDALQRWLALDGLAGRIEAAWQPVTVEDDDFRSRVVRQSRLCQQLEAAQQTVKWGPLLRAPQVYFDLLGEGGDKLTLLRDVAPPARGGTTRINEFFYIDDEAINHWNIDAEFCWPLIKSPSDTDTIHINPDDLNLKVFVCRKTKDELRTQGRLGTLRYIEWGEQQEYRRGVQQGMKWPEGPWVKNRRPGWYALPESETHFSQLFFTQAYGERHIQRYSPTPLVADARLYFLSVADDRDTEIISAVLNSSLVAFFTELVGRVTLGDGALELKVEDARDYLLVPDVRQFEAATRAAIAAAFQPLLARPIGPVFEEVKQPDRQALDRAILQALGLEPDKWLTRLYDGLITLVRQRVQLGQMRSQSRRSRPQKAAGRVAEAVLQDLLPHGPDNFPDDFLSPAALGGQFREIPLPDSPLSHKGHLFGREELAAEDGQTLQVANKFEARYLLFAQASGQKIARLPEKPVELSRAVNQYLQYLRDLQQQLYQAYFTRTLDQAAAERFAGEVWRKFNLPALEE